MKKTARLLRFFYHTAGTFARTAAWSQFRFAYRSAFREFHKSDWKRSLPNGTVTTTLTDQSESGAYRLQTQALALSCAMCAQTQSWRPGNRGLRF